MPSLRVNKELNDQMYFVTMTIKKWYRIFDRHDRWKILADSLKYLQKHKNLKLHAYVFMLNHIHIIIQSPDVSGAIRDFKSHTARALLQSIKEKESGKLKLFCKNDGTYELWQKTNMPELIETDYFLDQKMNYIHQNPVKKQYVKEASDWVWSSAGHYENEDEGYIKIDPLDI